MPRGLREDSGNGHCRDYKQSGVMMIRLPSQTVRGKCAEATGQATNPHLLTTADVGHQLAG
jgi:hypothetical protein